MNTIRDYNLMEPVPKPSRSSFFRARKADGPEEVLIERMDVSGLDASEISRALQELESLKALKSPHVGRVLDVFQDGRFILVVYESIADQPLFSAFPPGKTEPDVFLTLAQTLAQTLEDLHGQGIVHHLLNPETIRRDLDGNLRITGVVPSPLGAGFFGCHRRPPHDQSYPSLHLPGADRPHQPPGGSSGRFLLPGQRFP